MDPALVWIPPVTKARRGKRNHPAMVLFQSPSPLLPPVVSGSSAGGEPSAGKTHLPKRAPLRREHPCGIFWTVGPGNTIRRGRGVVLPESSWAARLSIRPGCNRL